MTNKIYVSIASYRDPLLQSTIDDLFNKANNKNNIIVGSYIQTSNNYYDHEKCLITNDYDGKVKYKIEKPGKIFSINKCRNEALSWLDESFSFVLQVDSHMRFKKGWDTSLINLWNSINNNKALISSTLPAWYFDKNNNEFFQENNNTFSRQEFNHEYSKKIFLNEVKLVPTADPIYAENYVKRGWYLSAHFIFGPAKYFIENKQIEWIVFWGEELMNSLVAYTNGWDVFLPSNKYIYHMFPQLINHIVLNKIWQDFPKNWDDKEKECSLKIIDCLINNLNQEIFGKNRNIDTLSEIIGYDISLLFKDWLKELTEKNI